MKKGLLRLAWLVVTSGWVVYLVTHMFRPDLINVGDKVILVLWGILIPYLAFLIETKIID